MSQENSYKIIYDSKEEKIIVLIGLSINCSMFSKVDRNSVVESEDGCLEYRVCEDANLCLNNPVMYFYEYGLNRSYMELSSDNRKFIDDMMDIAEDYKVPHLGYRWKSVRSFLEDWYEVPVRRYCLFIEGEDYVDLVSRTVKDAQNSKKMNVATRNIIHKILAMYMVSPEIIEEGKGVGYALKEEALSMISDEEYGKYCQRVVKDFKGKKLTKDIIAEYIGIDKSFLIEYTIQMASDVWHLKGVPGKIIKEVIEYLK